MTPLAPPPAPPMVPRLVEDVVPDDRDDPEIILNTTTVSSQYTILTIHLNHLDLTLLSMCFLVLLLGEDLCWSGTLWCVDGLGHS